MHSGSEIASLSFCRHGAALREQRESRREGVSQLKVLSFSAKNPDAKRKSAPRQLPQHSVSNGLKAEAVHDLGADVRESHLCSDYKS